MPKDAVSLEDSGSSGNVRSNNDKAGE